MEGSGGKSGSDPDRAPDPGGRRGGDLALTPGWPEEKAFSGPGVTPRSDRRSEGQMTRQRWISQCGAAAIVMAFASAAAAQMNVTTSDIQRLQDDAYQAGADVSRLRSTDPNLAAQLQTELDELRDEVVYLKVKLRKEGSVSRNDYADVRDRIQDLRSRARGDSGTARQGSGTGGTGTSGGVSGGVVGSERPQRTHGGSTAIASGQEIDVRLEGTLDSGTAQVEQRFQATTVVDLFRRNDVVVPAGSMLRGGSSSVPKATRT